MKKYRLTLSVIACLVSITLFGQLKVDSQGFVQANNTVIDGWARTPSTSYGVFSVTSSKTHPSYDPFRGYPAGLISTNSKIAGYYAYMNFYSGNLHCFNHKTAFSTGYHFCIDFRSFDRELIDLIAK